MVIFSCANLDDIDMAKMNHPAMNIDAFATGEISNRCTQLNGINAGSQVGCATCAK